MLIKIHSSYRSVVAVCDTELLGKEFEQGKLAIKLEESFFKGEEKSEKEIIEDLKRAADEDATFNIVGKQSVAAAIKAGIIKESGITKIQDIPIALVLL